MEPPVTDSVAGMWESGMGRLEGKVAIVTGAGRTGNIGAYKLTSVASAYYKGD